MGGTPQPIDAPAGGSPPTDPLIGRTLDGRYRITARIGAGGMGAVYRAEHTAIGKAFALKVLHPRLGAIAEAGQRFEREALAGGRIGHPNCVAVSDFGSFDDGAFYLVMELLDGESLGDLLDREGALPWRRALLIARHVLRGLGHAHDHGVVHRDMKPDNIFIAHTEDDADLAKILDFGIAKLVGEGGTNLTQAGITIGTPAYLSPEQAFGGELDGRSDVYSLSVVLYEMLTNTTPFAGRDALAMLTAHAVAEVPAMAEVAPDVSVPPAVEALVRDGLAKQAADRIGSAAEYVSRIDDLLTGRIATEPGAEAGVSMGRMATATPVPRLVTPSPTTGHEPTLHSGSHVVPTPMPTGTRDVVAPSRSWQRLAAYVAAGILGVGAIAALASSGGSGTKKPTPAKVAPASAAAKKAPDAAPKAAKPEPELPKATPDLAVVDAPIDAGAEAEPVTSADDAELAKALNALTKGKTCAVRKVAVARLLELGDKRAIPALKKARTRMYGGLLGIGRKNANSCLKAAATSAMAALQRIDAKLPTAPAP